MPQSDQANFLADEFPLANDISYLNHAAVAPWPKRTADAVIAFAMENCQRGAQHYPHWMATENQLREQLKTLTGAHSTDEIAFAKSTSEALSFVAYGLQWRAADEVLICDQEFPSNRIVWESLEDRFAVKTIRVSFNDDEEPEQTLLAAVTEKTRLVSVSSVQYGTGLKLNLSKLGKALRQKQVLFCVDAIQSLGICPVNVEEECIDFLMADGHKWLLGPEGLAVFYVRKDCQPLLSLSEFGWHMVKHRGDYSREDWQIAEDATRFECGSPNMVAVHALNASLTLILQVGIERINQLITANIQTLKEKLAGIKGLRLITPAAAARSAGILTFTIDSVDMERLHKQLVNHGVICAYRGGGIRFSPHFYTSGQALTKAVNTLKAVVLEPTKSQK